MSDAKLMRFNEIPQIDRGRGITSTPLVVEAPGAKVFSSGVTTFPPGEAIAVHTHNTDEQVTLLEGEGLVEMEGHQEQVSPYDTTFIPAGVPHRFINRGKSEMRILWIYGSISVTRTYMETGEETGQFGRLAKG